MQPRMTPMERLNRSGVTPDRALGQNFLIDPNIVDVIERTAELGSDDVVLEVGPGLGVLTERLVERCAMVHCVELDRDLARIIDEEFTGIAGFELYRADALELDLRSLEPAPTKLVSNLPYNVAAPLIINSLHQLPTVGLWCLMLQKEVADRLFAVPGSPDYGSISVLVQLTADKLSSRNVSGSVFHPRPRVRSSLLSFQRKNERSYTAAHFEAVQAVIRSSFSHRRKKLVNSMAEAGPDLLPRDLAGLADSALKQLISSALEGAGLDAGTRPQDLTPPQYESFARLMIEHGGRDA